MGFCEASAKDNFNVDEIFLKLVDDILKKMPLDILRNELKKILKQRCCPKQILFKGILKRYILLYQRTYMYLPKHSVSL
uniref:Uncharacterized protein n=1 Tax=Sciurus vulgaris TaxID=55149 RepID=A0A8D2DWL6_SCIVU